MLKDLGCRKKTTFNGTDRTAARQPDRQTDRDDKQIKKRVGKNRMIDDPVT